MSSRSPICKLGYKRWTDCFTNMPGYSIWYLLKPTHELHGRIRAINKELGTTPLPAHIPVISDISILGSATCLLEAYKKKKRPTFTFATRPSVITNEKSKILIMNVTSENPYGLWQFPISTRQEFFYNFEMSMVKMGQRTITPDEYELTLMDTRYVDKTLWKPVSAQIVKPHQTLGSSIIHCVNTLFSYSPFLATCRTIVELCHWFVTTTLLLQIKINRVFAATYTLDDGVCQLLHFFWHHLHNPFRVLFSRRLVITSPCIIVPQFKSFAARFVHFEPLHSIAHVSIVLFVYVAKVIKYFLFDGFCVTVYFLQNTFRKFSTVHHHG